MAYTIKQLAEISKVSTRTLRYYDKIKLLPPAYIGENKYRYYEKEQCLLLQQILFFRELDIPLKEIASILKKDDFNKIDCLRSHKQALRKNVERISNLIQTIDKTLTHLRGEVMMQDPELYEGFDPKAQVKHEEYLMEKGVSREIIDDSWDKVRNFTKEDHVSLETECKQITADIAKAIEQGLSPDEKTVQALVHKHYLWICHYWTPTRETYIGLSQLYYDSDEFNKFYTEYHPNMVEYLMAAMRHYAEHSLE